MFGDDNLDVLYVPSIGVKIGDLDPVTSSIFSSSNRVSDPAY